MRGGGQQQTPNPALDFFLIVGFFVCICVALWYNYHTEIVSKAYALRIFEAKIIYQILSYLDAALKPYGFDITADDNIFAYVELMSSVDPSTVDYKTFGLTMNNVGKFLIVPTVSLSVIFASLILFVRKGSGFKQVYTMDTFSQLESQVHQEISPVMGKNLIKNGLDEGPWAMSIQPMDFAKKYNLIEEIVQPDGTKKATLIKGRAHDVFCTQMGPRWEGTFDNCPAYMMALFAIFAAKSQNDDKGAKKLIKQIAASSKTGKLDFSGTRALLIKHVKAPIIGRTVGPHAYILTMMASMLELARTDGVLATAEILWLKPVDRRMWYMLNSVGRPTCFPEVAGPFGHWIIEKRLRRPLKVPCVSEAVEGLDEALSEIVYDSEDA